MGTMSFRVNQKLLPLKMVYFTLSAAFGCLFPFLAVYMRQLGLSPSECGIIMSVSTLTTAVLRTATGVIADKLRRHLTILNIYCIMTTISHIGLLFVPGHCNASYQNFTEVSCPNSTVCDWMICKTVNNPCVAEKTTTLSTGASNVVQISSNESRGEWNCGVICCCDNVNSTTNSCSSVNMWFCNEECNKPEAESTDAMGNTFWLVFGLYFSGNYFFMTISSIVDGLSYACLGDNPQAFGRQRSWGSIGAGLFGVVSGIAMDWFQTSDSEKNYTVSFILFSALVIAATVIANHIQASVEAISGSLKSNFVKILCNIELGLILLTAVVSGCLSGVQESFLFWFLQSIGAPQILMGISLLIMCASETVMMNVSGKIINKLGTNACLCMAFAAFGIRFLGYSFLINPWYVLAIEPLHGICFGLLYPSMSNRASELTPAGMHTTVQSLVGTLHFSLGRALGVATAGVLYDKIGPINLFRLLSIVAVSYIVFIIITKRLTQRSLKETGSAVTEVVGDTHSTVKPSTFPDGDYEDKEIHKFLETSTNETLNDNKQ